MLCGVASPQQPLFCVQVLVQQGWRRVVQPAAADSMVAMTVAAYGLLKLQVRQSWARVCICVQS
jgi:hypothetical protein